jgi:CheY-like chemotaxis protein
LVRILVVDDNEPTRELVGEALVMAGFEVQRAESGSAALSRINAGFMPDLLLTDLSMPGMDGIQLIRAVRRQIQALPAIILTGNTGAIASLAIEEVVGGRCSILHKPIRVTELSDHIHLMLNGTEKASSLLAA